MSESELVKSVKERISTGSLYGSIFLSFLAFNWKVVYFLIKFTPNKKNPAHEIKHAISNSLEYFEPWSAFAAIGMGVILFLLKDFWDAIRSYISKWAINRNSFNEHQTREYKDKLENDYLKRITKLRKAEGIYNSALINFNNSLKNKAEQIKTIGTSYATAKLYFDAATAFDREIDTIQKNLHALLSVKDINLIHSRLSNIIKLVSSVKTDHAADKSKKVNGLYKEVLIFQKNFNQSYEHDIELEIEKLIKEEQSSKKVKSTKKFKIIIIFFSILSILISIFFICDLEL